MMLSGDSCRRAARNAAVSASRRGASQARTRRRSFAGSRRRGRRRTRCRCSRVRLGRGPERVAVDGRRSARRCREALPGPSVVTPLLPLNPARTAKRRGVTPTPQTDRCLLAGSVDRVTRSSIEWPTSETFRDPGAQLLLIDPPGGDAFDDGNGLVAVRVIGGRRCPVAAISSDELESA
jgi:hypothetical protein